MEVYQAKSDRVGCIEAFMVVRLRPILVAAIFLCGRAIAADYPDAANGILGVVDIPSISKPRPVATPHGLEGGAPWTITCFDYPGYRVKELDGDGKGVAVVSVQVTRIGAILPFCGAQDDPGERVIAREGLSLAGARGGFVFLVPTDGPATFVYDAVSGRQVYTDDVENGKVLAFQVAGDLATMSYVRHVSAPCPLLTGGAACWQRFVREARLSAEVARMGPVSAACETAFRAANSSYQIRREDYNVLTYEATVTFDRSGHTAVVSRANPGCSFDP